MGGTPKKKKTEANIDRKNSHSKGVIYNFALCHNHKLSTWIFALISQLSAFHLQACVCVLTIPDYLESSA